jgi:3-oxoacyl-[acyl-carrier protein] reductase
MTKGAVAALTRGLARDLGPRGITVNVVQPEPTETDMNADGDVRAMVRPLTAVGRMGNASEMRTWSPFSLGPSRASLPGPPSRSMADT